MKTLLFAVSLMLLSITVNSEKIDSKLLKCLVCRVTVGEIQGELAKIDPSIEIEIGNYRLDAHGNMLHKKVPLAQSEVHISDMLDSVCSKMSDYVRARYKSNGQLTILSLMNPSGQMNPELSKVDIIQDGDLNKSLKYYCEGLIEENEESIISLFVRKETNIKGQLCTDIAKLCDSTEYDEEEPDDFQEDDTDEEHDEL